MSAAKKHTPGPLMVLQNKRDGADRFLVVVATKPKKTALALVARGPDADLYAAAPDLLAALRAIAESSGRYDDPEHDADPIEHALVMRDIALGAIAKAEGRE